jgi:acyl-CoA-binding protein
VIQRAKVCPLYGTVSDIVANHNYGRWEEVKGLSQTNGS